ncbi:MAG: hypothetical protein IKP28_06480 [Clostridia bacterium]|nr:hypothetical protein [Clostridia bacterium]
MEHGTNKLLKNGAILATCTRDIINCFPNLCYKEENEHVHHKQISDEHMPIFKAIEEGINDANEISRMLNMPINTINSGLFMMELDGIIEKNSNGEYILKEG